jgi:hypothetical protein
MQPGILSTLNAAVNGGALTVAIIAVAVLTAWALFSL